MRDIHKRTDKNVQHMLFYCTIIWKFQDSSNSSLFKCMGRINYTNCFSSNRNKNFNKCVVAAIQFFVLVCF